MNRYIAAALVADMRAGKRIVALAPDGKWAANMARHCERELQVGEQARPTRLGGSIASDTGGWIRFYSLRAAAWRSGSADVVYLDRQPPRTWTSDKIREFDAAVRALLVTGGEFILP